MELFLNWIVFLAPWSSGYHSCTSSFNWAWTQVLCRFKPCSRRVGDSAGNKAKRLSLVNHTTKTIQHTCTSKTETAFSTNTQISSLQIIQTCIIYNDEYHQIRRHCTPMIDWKRIFGFKRFKSYTQDDWIKSLPLKKKTIVLLL